METRDDIIVIFIKAIGGIASEVKIKRGRASHMSQILYSIHRSITFFLSTLSRLGSCKPRQEPQPTSSHLYFLKISLTTLNCRPE